MSEPMDEVRANTTPGTDPRVEELNRAPMHHQQGSMDDRAMEGRSMHDGPAEGRGEYDRSMEGDRGSEGVMDEGRDPRRMDGREGYGHSTDGDDGVGGADDPVGHYRSRFAEAQSRFIDDPKRALEEARSVVEEAIDKYMDSLRMDAGAGNGDTEQMRRAMQRYRDFFDRLAGGSRA